MGCIEIASWNCYYNVFIMGLGGAWWRIGLVLPLGLEQLERVLNVKG
jgi:hypothetical protein